MARPLRLEFPGALYHVMARGNRREAIYISSADFGSFLDCLGEACMRFNWVCHAYCLMTNHYHLLIETHDGNLSRGMRHLNGVYSQAFNRAHNKVGHVFQGRYKAIVVQKEAYLLELARYIVLNPIRARMVTALDEWPWSSYPAMLGLVNPPQWLAANNLLRQFGATFRAARQAYRKFISDGAGLPSPVADPEHQILLGDDAFKSRFINDTHIDSEITRLQRRAIAQPLAHYAAITPDRDSAVVAAYSSGAFTQKEIAIFFGVHYATVSRILAKSRVSDGNVQMLQCKT